MLPVNADTNDKPEVDVSPGSIHPAIWSARSGGLQGYARRNKISLWA